MSDALTHIKSQVGSTIADLKGLLDLGTLDQHGAVKLVPDTLDWSRCREVRLEDGTLSPIKAHAKIGVRALLANPWLMIADEMGGMKTAQCIVAAQFLYLNNVIDRVIVITPPSVRDVWFDKDIGELSLHLFHEGIAARVSEYHSKTRQWDHGDWNATPGRQLRWIITNYEFIARSTMRLKVMLQFCGPRTLLIIDESSAIRNKTSLQSKAVLALRKRCGRAVELNGTPISETLMDLLNQMNVLHPSILNCPYITTFRDRYCVMNANVDYPEILSWKNVDDLQRRLAPYVLRRLKEQCLDLPPNLPAVAIPVALTETTWKQYKAMHDDFVAYVSSNEASIASQAMTKAMRLAQITSGFLGGIEEVFEEPDDVVPEHMQDESWFLDAVIDERTSVETKVKPVFTSVRAIGREKLDATLDFYRHHYEQDPAFKLVLWFRFRPELERFMDEFEAAFPKVRTGRMLGQQKKLDRQLALRLLHPRTCVRSEPALLAGIYGTGSMGHNFTAAHVVVNVSYDYSLFQYLQAAARVHRPGQTKAVSNFNMVATGPKGQKTIDHKILKLRQNKQDMATLTASAWLHLMTEDD